MAIRDLCSRQVLASVAFLTGPVDGSFIIRSVWLGKLVVFVFEVPTTMAQCVIPVGARSKFVYVARHGFTFIHLVLYQLRR